MVGVGILVDLPVQPDGAGVVLLKAVHPQIAGACLGMLGVRKAQIQKAAAVVGPGLNTREQAQINLVAGEYHVLTRTTRHRFGRGGTQRTELAERFLEPTEPDR